MTAKSVAINARGGKSGRCAVKAAGLTSGGPRRVRDARTEWFRKGRERGAEVSREHSSRPAGEGTNDEQGQQGSTLMRTRRQKDQLERALELAAKGEARRPGRGRR